MFVQKRHVTHFYDLERPQVSEAKSERAFYDANQILPNQPVVSLGYRYRIRLC